MVTAILVTNITYADYMVGSVVGAIYKLPVYYVYQDPFSINNTVQELLQNNVTDVIVIGGPAVISNLLLQELNESGINYVWIWGTTRYDTSSYVALYFWNNSDSAVLITRDLVNKNVKGDKLELVTEAVETAESNKIPLLIVPDGVLPSTTVYALEKLNVSSVYIFTGNSGELGNILDQLNSLNISYKIYTPNVSIPNECTNYIYVNITPNTSWEDIREIFIGKIHGFCIVPQVVNESVNVTLEKEEIKNEIEKDFEEFRNNSINSYKLVLDHINRMLGLQELLLYKFEIICNKTNNSLPICTSLPQLNQTLQQTIQELESGNLTAIPLFQNDFEMYNWEVTREVGEGYQENVENEEFEKIENKIEEIKNRRFNWFINYTNISNWSNNYTNININESGGYVNINWGGHYIWR